MVAVREGRPTPVPRLACETRADRIRFLQGQARREIRQKHTKEREAAFERFEQATDEELEALMRSVAGA